MNDYYSNLPHGSYLETIEKINKSLMPISKTLSEIAFDTSTLTRVTERLNRQMAKNERLIALCLLDEVSKRNITVGNLSIMRPKGKTDAPQIEEVFENVQYVKLEFIDYMYRDAKKRLIGYIRDHGLRQQDLEGCLGDLLDEEWYKINM